MVGSGSDSGTGARLRRYFPTTRAGFPMTTDEELDRAGKVLMDLSDDNFDNWSDAYDLVNDWRTLHRVPLQTFRNNLSRRVKKTGIVAQRLKRLTSIIFKLDRLDWMSLSKMQDIGGCRAVVRSADKALGLATDLAESRIRHKLIRSKDYVEAPRHTGYRGIHLVYSYRTDRASRKELEGLNIEIQIRSERQHQWATAVETVGAFTGDDLKSGDGDGRWLRFFALMSSVIAQQEDKPIVPNTPDSRTEIVRELREWDGQLGNVEGHLEAFEALTRVIPKAAWVKRRKNPWVVLVLDLTAKMFTAETFDGWQEAGQYYRDQEVEHRDDRSIETVMVSVSSLQELQKAYPNYYVDLKEFRLLLRETLEGA